jgi:ParB family chromosome partitioning protein
LDEIKASILDDDLAADEMEMFKRSVAENVNRADMTPMEEARAFHRILKGMDEDATAADVAKEVNRSAQYVTLRLALLNLAEEVQKYVNSGAIGTQAAVQIAALTPANQSAVMRKWAKGAFAGDNELVHFAYALRQQQGQVLALIVEDLTEEQQAERQRVRTATRKNLDAIERVRALLEELGKADPMKLALALEGEVGTRLEQLDRVAQSLQDARFALRQAKAHAEAREIALNPDAVTGEGPTAPAEGEADADSPSEAAEVQDVAEEETATDEGTGASADPEAEVETGEADLPTAA